MKNILMLLATGLFFNGYSMERSPDDQTARQRVEATASSTAKQQPTLEELQPTINLYQEALQKHNNNNLHYISMMELTALASNFFRALIIPAGFSGMSVIYSDFSTGSLLTFTCGAAAILDLLCQFVTNYSLNQAQYYQIEHRQESAKLKVFLNSNGYDLTLQQGHSHSH